MKIAVAGTGYVGLVTGVAMAEIGHDVTCVDIDEEKVKIMRAGISPIYEEGLEELMQKNNSRLSYTTKYHEAYKDAKVIFIGVGTPERSDGSANLEYVFSVVDQIAESLENDCVVVVKSTVPIGTNDEVEKRLKSKVRSGINVFVASNPEFLAQGTAVKDTLNASRIVVGADEPKAIEVMKKVYEPLTLEPYNVPYLNVGRRSAEMIKYASNDFLALKLSFINEISNLCEQLGADIDEVTLGMAHDSRIGNKFLNAGIGYGGSCFPKDTKALHRLSQTYGSELLTVAAGIEVNRRQKLHLIQKLSKEFGCDLRGFNIVVLGASFKPGTDDLREAPSIDNVNLLLEYGANVAIYDPVALDNFKKIFGDKIEYCSDIYEALNNRDIAMIMTEWPQIRKLSFQNYIQYMKTPFIYDGRNCYSLDDAQNAANDCEEFIYTSMGRGRVIKKIDNIKTER